jgi:hypothetical protein
VLKDFKRHYTVKALPNINAQNIPYVANVLPGDEIAPYVLDVPPQISLELATSTADVKNRYGSRRVNERRGFGEPILGEMYVC